MLIQIHKHHRVKNWAVHVEIVLIKLYLSLGVKYSDLIIQTIKGLHFIKRLFIKIITFRFRSLPLNYNFLPLLLLILYFNIVIPPPFHLFKSLIVPLQIHLVSPHYLSLFLIIRFLISINLLYFILIYSLDSSLLYQSQSMLFPNLYLKNCFKNNFKKKTMPADLLIKFLMFLFFLDLKLLILKDLFFT